MMTSIAYLVSIKGPIIIFHLKGHAVKLKCVNYKIFWKNMIFAKKRLFQILKIYITLIPTFTL